MKHEKESEGDNEDMKPLRIEYGRLQGGSFTQGKVSDWEWFKNGGHYVNNRDFFTVHWEVQERDPGVVRLHIEAPRYANDDYLNGLKGRLVHLLLGSDLHKQVEQSGYTYQPGSRTSEEAISNNKCTEAFRVILRPTQRHPSTDEDIRSVHERLGESVDRVVSEVGASLDTYFRIG